MFVHHDLARRVRMSAALVLAALMTFAVWAPQPAMADPVDGTVGTLVDRGHALTVPGGSLVNTGLIEVSLSNGASARTYCIELATPVRSGAPMVESTWADLPGPSDAAENSAQVNWIVQNTYPVIDRMALEARLIDDGVTLNGGLDLEEALAGSQAAIWHFTDDFEPVRPDASPRADDAADEDILAVYDHLVDAAAAGAPEAPPALDVEESSATGRAGQPIGPFHVGTTAFQYGLNVEDLPVEAEITDADGERLERDDLTNGSAFYVLLPAGSAGEGDVVVHAVAPLGAGRVMVGTEWPDNPTQALIVAASSSFEISETVHVTWTQPPVTPGDVTVTGHPVVGETLTAETSGWEPDDVELSHQWLRDGDPIDGADASTYTLRVGDEGHSISVRVEGTAPGHAAADATSDEVMVTRGELELSDDEVDPGDDLTVTGSGFAPDTEYDLELRSTPVDLGSITTDATGAFSRSVSIPDDATAGDHRIALIAGSGVVAATADLEIEGAGSSGGAVLPNAGGLPMALLVLAGLLLLAGAHTLRRRAPAGAHRGDS